MPVSSLATCYVTADGLMGIRNGSIGEAVVCTYLRLAVIWLWSADTLSMGMRGEAGRLSADEGAATSFASGIAHCSLSGVTSAPDGGAQAQRSRRRGEAS
jgi:hypothetical protein